MLHNPEDIPLRLAAAASELNKRVFAVADTAHS
jgi:hypothetical protein